MSVINKVLRDLDQRQSGQRASGSADGAGVRRAAPVRRSSGQAVRWALGGGVLAVLVLGAYLAWTIASKSQVGAAVVVPSPGALLAPLPTPAAAPQLPPEQTPVAVARVTVADPAVSASRVTKMPTPAKVQPARAAGGASVPAMSAPAPQAMPAATVMATAQALPPQRGEAAPVAPRVPSAASAGTAALPSAEAPRPTQQAAQEALAQAQALWLQGNQTGALELVRSVIARLQRSPAGQSDMLASAAREYVRMALALQRAPDALALLVQLESPLAKVADIWALRGNVAQRLGLHAQAVHAYLNALELAPGQARWMLAAAVSLAAQGQKVPAAELAEKAQRAGFLPPDVANYLRQSGVELRAP